MPRTVEWKLVVDEEGSIKKMEMVGKEAEKVDKHFDKTKHEASSLKESLKGLGGEFGGLKSVMGGVGSALGLGGLAFGLDDAIKKTITLGEETDKFAGVTGMSTRTSMDYVAALKARGVGAEAGANAFAYLAKNIQTAERQQFSYSVGAEKAHMTGRIYTSLLGVQAEAFEKLGINLAQFKALKPEQQLEEVISKFEALKNPVEKDQLAMEVFGRSGKNLLPVLVGGELGLKSFKKSAEEMYPTFGTGKHGLEEFMGAQEKMQMGLEALEVRVGTAVIPTFLQLYKEIKNGKGAWGELGKGVSTAVEGLGGLVKDLEEAAKWLGIIKGHGHQHHGHSSHHSNGHSHHYDHHAGHPSGGLGDLAHILELGGAVGGAAGAYGLVRHPFRTLKGLGKGTLGGLRGLGRLAFPAEGDAAGGLLGSELLGGLAGSGAFAVGASIPFASASGLKAAAELIHPGMLQQHTVDEEDWLALTGFFHKLKPMGGGKELKGTAAPMTRRGDLERRALMLRNQAIERYAHEHHQALQSVDRQYEHGKLELNIDGVKVGEAISRNARAMRYLAEGVERAVLQRTARK